MSLEEEFTELLRGTYEAGRQRGYLATYLLEMLEEHGGVGTAKRLLAPWTDHQGLYKLYGLGLIQKSVEAIVWDHREFHPFFTEVELGIAYRRLEELGYFVEGK